MRVLQIVETAYRATTEEQDDTVIWITHAMKGAGGELDVLLVGNAVNYTQPDQDASGLSFGDWRQTQPPRIGADVANLKEKGVNVLVLREDMEERGLSPDKLSSAFEAVGRDDLPELFENYDRIWYW